MHSDFENSHNSSYENLHNRRKTLVRGKENTSLNRNSTIYSSITNVLEKSTPPQTLQVALGTYFGQIKGGKAHGVGTCLMRSGGLYYGEWRNNQIHGVGIYFFGVGGFIRGDFACGRAEGMAELVFQNGQTYQGSFKDGKQHGPGIKTGRRGRENVHHRDGVRVYGDEVFMGLDLVPYLKNHLPHIYVHADRTVYGLSCDLSGLGAIYYQSGRVDIGWFQNGFLNGFGRIVFKSGDIYEGQLRNGQFSGEGFYLNYFTKQMTEGVFERNQMVQIKDQKAKYPPTEERPEIVDERILIKNIHLKTRVQFTSTDRQPTKVNKIQNLISHMLNPKKNVTVSRSEINGSVANEEVLDNLLSRVQSPKQRRNLESIISQVTSPQRIR